MSVSCPLGPIYLLTQAVNDHILCHLLVVAFSDYNFKILASGNSRNLRHLQTFKFRNFSITISRISGVVKWECSQQTLKAVEQWMSFKMGVTVVSIYNWHMIRPI